VPQAHRGGSHLPGRGGAAWIRAPLFIVRFSNKHARQFQFGRGRCPRNPERRDAAKRIHRKSAVRRHNLGAHWCAQTGPERSSGSRHRRFATAGQAARGHAPPIRAERAGSKSPVPVRDGVRISKVSFSASLAWPTGAEIPGSARERQRVLPGGCNLFTQESGSGSRRCAHPPQRAR
jgi:hypothetical protein